MTLAYNPETWAIRDALRDALSSRTPRTAPQLFQSVLDDIGSIDERRLWRQLAWLTQRGIAVGLAVIHGNQSSLEDTGYVRGTGLEYPDDAAIRERVELSRDGLCWDCREPNADPARRQEQYCVWCELEQSQAFNAALRADRYAAGVCTECAVVRPRDGHRLCDGCNTAKNHRAKHYAVPRDADAWSLRRRAA